MAAFIGTKAARKAIQARLIELGYSCGPDGADGVLGPASVEAIVAFRRDHHLSPEPLVDWDFMQALDPIPEPSEKGQPKMKNWLTGFVGTTAFKYLVAMIATYAASKLGLDPVEGKATIEGVLTQLIGVVMGGWGMWEASRQKIVIGGEKVSVSDLTQTDKATVQAIVNKAK